MSPWEVIEGLASGVAFFTGHEAELDYPALAAFPGTLAIYMGMNRMASLAASLLAHLPAETPAAIVQSASQPNEAQLLTTLGRLAADAQERAGEDDRKRPHERLEGPDRAPGPTSEGGAPLREPDASIADGSCEVGWSGAGRHAHLGGDPDERTDGPLVGAVGVLHPVTEPVPALRELQQRQGHTPRTDLRIKDRSVPRRADRPPLPGGTAR